MIGTIIAALRTSRAAQIVLVAVAVAALLFLLARRADRAQDTAVEQARDGGAAQQRSEDQAAILNQVEKAKNAQDAIRVDNSAARAGCLRYSRTPENC